MIKSEIVYDIADEHSPYSKRRKDTLKEDKSELKKLEKKSNKIKQVYKLEESNEEKVDQKKQNEKQLNKQIFQEDIIEVSSCIQQKQDILQQKTQVKNTKKKYCIYDFIKVKIMLNDNNFYVFSRFLVCRILNFCKVPSNGRSRSRTPSRSLASSRSRW